LSNEEKSFDAGRENFDFVSPTWKIHFKGLKLLLESEVVLFEMEI
jgi:hypothetical protein